MASQLSSSKPKKGLRKLIKETLHVKSRSKSPSQISNQSQRPEPPGPAGTSKITQNLEHSHGGADSEHAGGTTGVATLESAAPPNAAWAGLRNSLRSLRDAASEIPFGFAIEGLLSCLAEFEIATEVWRDCDHQASNLTALSNSLEQLIREEQSIVTTNALLKFGQCVEEQVANLRAGLEREGRRDVLAREENRRDLVACFGKFESLFLHLEVNIKAELWSVANQAMDTLRERLNPVKYGAYDVSGSPDLGRSCVEGTRTGVLDQLDKWLDESTNAPIFWISGTAGTGKTTIARTFCDRADARKPLAARFFCSRNSAECKDMTRIVPTIAYQIAQYSSPFRRELYEVLTSDPGIMSREAIEQMKDMILGPLAKAKAQNAMPENMVVVIDGLDECEEQSGQPLLDAILQYLSELPLKFLLTSRQKAEKLEGGTQARSFTSIHLDDVERSVVRADLGRYLQAELSPLTPTSEQVEQLVERTGMLFVCAAILVRFILLDDPRYSPQNRLELILSMTLESTKKHTYIDALYTTILHSVLNEEEEHKNENARMVLWTVLFAQEPIGVETIAVLGGIDDGRVRTALQPLQSVLAYSSETDLVSTLDVHFPEFMLDRDRSGVFFYDIAEHSRQIAGRCFEVMKAGLRFNICGLESSFVRDQDVKDLQNRIDENISPTLSYACRHWASHLELAAVCDSLLQRLEEFILAYLLFWMEVMNVKKEMRCGILGLMKADRWVKVVGSTAAELVSMVADAYDFVTSYGASPISQSTPHIYISALPFCRRSSQVYKLYSPRTSGLLDMKHSMLAYMEVAPLATWTVDSGLSSVAYSSDGSRIVIGFDNGTARIWDAYDGTPLVGPFQCHRGRVNLVAFSLDGRTFATASWHHSFRVWDAISGAPTTDEFQDNSNSVVCISFTPDGTLMVLTSGDSMIRIWSVSNGAALITPLEGYMIDGRAIFSPDGAHVAASANGNLLLVNIRSSPHSSTTLKGHSGYANTIVFSPDGLQVVCGSSDETIRVWSVRDGALLRELTGHFGHFYSVTISPNGRRIAAASNDNTIRAWDINDGSLVTGPFLGPNFSVAGLLNAVMYSPDGTRLISRFDHGAIRLWSARDGVFPPDLPSVDMFLITSLMFSPSESRIYSTFPDQTVLWDAHDGSFAVDTPSGNLHTSYSLPLSPDGAAIAIFLDDHSVEVVSTKDGSLIAGPFRGHTEPVVSAAFSTDGSYLITGSADGTARVWGIEDGRLAAGPLVGHTGAVRFVSLSPDCSRAVTHSIYDVIRIWNVRNSMTHEDVTTPHGWSPFSFSENHSRVFAGWTVQADGWVTNGDGSLLFWLPIDLSSKPAPDTELIIGMHGSLGIPKQSLLLGHEWGRCYMKD